ncbi:MAG TPA: DUF4350 domain-containing protein [Gemmataceae bacterium]|jgi:hypothetical protein|nr:DUF4350 domain-containing protein [Gemmataceae bacterium]
MSRFVAWLVVVALLGAFGAVVVGALRERAAAGQGMPPYSVYSEAGDGLGEAAHLLRQLGWETMALTRPAQVGQHRGLLVLLEPERSAGFGEEGGLSEVDAGNLLRWVEAGNTLLFASRRNTALHRALGLTVTEGPRAEGDGWTAVDRGAAGGYTAGIEHLSVGSAATLQGGGLPLWYVKDRPGAVLLRRGAGRVVVLASPALLSRRGLVRSDGEPRDDNAVFLYNVASLDARDGKVYFDEYHHGLRAASGFWGYLAYHGRRWALLPLLVVAGVWAWTWAVRLGPAVPPRRADSADAVDYASALGRLYQGAGARRLLARTLSRNFLTALTKHLRLRRTALPAVILAAWRQQDAGPSAQRLQALLRGLADLRKPDLTDAQLLSWARAFDEFTEQTLQGPRPRPKGG